MPNTRPADYLVFCENVTKAYGAKIVLEDIDLAVREGEFCTVVGPSGCGKSTLLRLILGQEQVSSGTLLIGGRRLLHPGPDRGIVYQKYSLFPHLTILENIMAGKDLSQPLWRTLSARRAAREEAHFYLRSVQLDGHADKYPHQLSGGMQQRVAIAQALIMKPRILLMDEPFGALDPGTRENMQLFILELWEKYAMTLFFVTHDLEEAVFLGTRILVISQYYVHETKSDGQPVGARIVADYKLNDRAWSTRAKQTAAFGELIQKIRYEGFEPEARLHAHHFNLSHSDSFITYENARDNTDRR
jgi:NitT/TauT family transport system ATP-binding protein